MTLQLIKCEWCGSPDAIRYHQGTLYEKDEDNYKILCNECRKQNDEYWAEMWAMRDRECM